MADRGESDQRYVVRWVCDDVRISRLLAKHQIVRFWEIFLKSLLITTSKRTRFPKWAHVSIPSLIASVSRREILNKLTRGEGRIEGNQRDMRCARDAQLRGGNYARSARLLSKTHESGMDGRRKFWFHAFSSRRSRLRFEPCFDRTLIKFTDKWTKATYHLYPLDYGVTRNDPRWLRRPIDTACNDWWSK